MEVEIIQIERRALEAMIRGILGEELKDLKAAVLYQPDTTPVSDDEAAERLHTSVSTVRRMKKDGRLNSVPTAKGRLVRVCDVEDYYTPKKFYFEVK
jgi:excisionase family DNA binding protein